MSPPQHCASSCKFESVVSRIRVSLGGNEGWGVTHCAPPLSLCPRQHCPLLCAPHTPPSQPGYGSAYSAAPPCPWESQSTTEEILPHTSALAACRTRPSGYGDSQGCRERRE
ncbi:hypothetical protein FKM82_030835 [Ascaphus truei]